MNTREWLPRSEVCRRLGVHKKTIIRWVGEGRLRERRDEAGRAFCLRSDVDRLAGERAVATPMVQTVKAPPANRVAVAPPGDPSPGGLTLTAAETRSLCDALGGAEPTVPLLAATLEAWSAGAASWHELSEALGCEPDVAALVRAVEVADAHSDLEREVARGHALILRGDQLELYRRRVTLQLIAGSVVAVRVAQLEELGLLDGDEDTDDRGPAVWRRLTKLREEIEEARRAAALATMQRDAAVERWERLDELLRAAGFTSGADAFVEQLAARSAGASAA